MPILYDVRDVMDTRWRTGTREIAAKTSGEKRVDSLSFDQDSAQ